MEQAKKKILIVDDEAALTMIYSDAFSSEGYEVKTCENGELAVQLVRDFRPDLILLDIMMPRVNGLEVLELFRSDPSLSNSVVVMMSAIGDSETVAKAKALGAQDYIVKSSTSLDEVISKIKFALGDSEQTPAAPQV